MNDDMVQKMIDEQYDPTGEDGLKQMVKDFYNRRMLSIVAVFWGSGLAFMAVAVWWAVAFFRAEATRDQIMYAAGFVVLMTWLGLLKVFAWQMIHRNSIKRELKRLELRIAQLSREA